MTFEDLSSHADRTITEDMVKYCMDDAFEYQQYIIYRKLGKKAICFCTHCGKWLEMDKDCLKHNQLVKCTECGYSCFAKASGILARGGVRDAAYFVHFKKSAEDPSAIVAMGVYALRKTVAPEELMPADILPQFHAEDVYLFRQGETVHYHNDWYNRDGDHYRSFWPARGFYEVKAISDRSRSGGLKTTPCYIDMISLYKAIKGTPFERFDVRKYAHTLGSAEFGQMLPFLAVCAKYPCVEYLLKMGFFELVDDKVRGYQTYGAVYWRGKTAKSVLRVSGSAIGKLRAFTKSEHVTPEYLKWFQTCQKHGMNLSCEQVYELKSKSCGIDAFMNSEAVNEIGFAKVAQYCLKQKRTTYGYILNDLRDYWRECADLGLDLEKESVRWPKDLYRAHELTAKAIRIKADLETSEMIRKVVQEGAALYSYEYEGLLIRPARDSEELIAEGQALNHCVASYANRYAKGEVMICVIRKVNDPDTPFYTAEFDRKGQLVQCRGHGNCNMTKDVKAFVDAVRHDISLKLRRKAS